MRAWQTRLIKYKKPRSRKDINFGRTSLHRPPSPPNVSRYHHHYEGWLSLLPSIIFLCLRVPAKSIWLTNHWSFTGVSLSNRSLDLHKDSSQESERGLVSWKRRWRQCQCQLSMPTVNDNANSDAPGVFYIHFLEMERMQGRSISFVSEKKFFYRNTEC